MDTLSHLQCIQLNCYVNNLQVDTYPTCNVFMWHGYVNKLCKWTHIPLAMYSIEWAMFNNLQVGTQYPTCNVFNCNGYGNNHDKWTTYFPLAMLYSWTGLLEGSGIIGPPTYLKTVPYNKSA